MKQNMFMKLRNLYYKLKYRNLKGSSGAVGVIIGNKKKNNDFNDKLDEIARTTQPCYKTNAEVLAYIKEKYDLTPTPFSAAEIENYKVNYILNNCPEVLSTPEQSLPNNGKSPTRKQMQAFQESSSKRFEEAWNYPIEKLGLDIETYTFEYALSDDFSVTFRLIAENTTDTISISSSAIGTAEHNISEDERDLIHRIFCDIDIYKGVTQEDIDNRTKRFYMYAAWVIELEKTKK